MPTSDSLPATLEEALRLLAATVPSAQQAAIAATVDEDLIHLHFGLGMWIRNTLGLWSGNSALMRATGARSPDDASQAIILAFRNRLRDGRPRLQ